MLTTTTKVWLIKKYQKQIRKVNMASFKFNGMIPDDDPRYQEGITIMIGLGLNEKSRTKPKKTKKKMSKKVSS